jgi:polar amino acid transport system substrate-binding protein
MQAGLRYDGLLATRAMRIMLDRLLPFLIAALAVAMPTAQANAAEVQLAPSGTLRAAFIVRNPVQASVDPTNGAISGLAAELTRAAAAKLNVPFTLTGLQGASAVIASVQSGEADIGFVAYNFVRAGDVDFSQPYALVQNAYLVRTDSSFRKSEELDQPGRVIGVGMRDPADFFLTRTLDQATLKRNDGSDSDAAARMLLAGEIDAYGANRQRLTPLAARTPGVRLLEDNFYTVEQTIAVAKGRAGHLEFVNRLIDEARASGLIGNTITGAGLIGVEVAPRSGEPR